MAYHILYTDINVIRKGVELFAKANNCTRSSTIITHQKPKKLLQCHFINYILPVYTSIKLINRKTLQSTVFKGNGASLFLKLYLI